MVRVLVGVRGCVLWPMGHSLVKLFPCLSRLRTNHCIGLCASHILIILSTYLYMGIGKACCSLVMGFDSFPDRLSGGGDGGGLSTALSLGLRCGGLESKFGRGPRPLDRRVVGWSCLCLGYKRGVCFGVPSWATLIHESPCNTILLVYDLAP